MPDMSIAGALMIPFMAVLFISQILEVTDFSIKPTLSSQKVCEIHGHSHS